MMTTRPITLPSCACALGNNNATINFDPYRLQELGVNSLLAIIVHYQLQTNQVVYCRYILFYAMGWGNPMPPPPPPKCS